MKRKDTSFKCQTCGERVKEGESQGFDFDMCQDCWDNSPEFREDVGRGDFPAEYD